MQITITDKGGGGVKMFFCDECAETNLWPKSLEAKTPGKCNTCDEYDLCNDIPLRHLSPLHQQMQAENEVG